MRKKEETLIHVIKTLKKIFMILCISHCYLHKFLSSPISPLLNNQIPVSSLCSKVQGKFPRNSCSGLLFVLPSNCFLLCYRTSQSRNNILRWYLYMPLASIFFLILLLLGLKIFSTVKGIIAAFSPSLTYLHLLFILLLCISQWVASVNQLFWPPPDSSVAVGVVWRSSCGWHSELQMLPLTLTEIKTYCPGDGASGSSRKSLGRRVCSSSRTECMFFEKWQHLMGHMRLQEVLCSTQASKSLSLPIDMDYILAAAPMTEC